MYSWQPWANGAIKTIDGVQTFSNTQLPGSQPIIGLTSWQDPAQIGVNGPIAIAATNGKIYTSPLSSISWTDRTGSTTPTTTASYTFDSLNGNLLIFNAGMSQPLVLTTYNGNVANLGGSPPNGSAVKVVNNFAFVGCLPGAASTASTVYWSAVSDPTTWPAASNITFRQNDGDFVTALSAINGNLLIFKRYSIGLLNTTSTVISGSVTLGPLTTLTDRIGCAGPTSVDIMPDGTVVFLAMDRCLYQTDGVSVQNMANMPSPNSNYSFFVNNIGFPSSPPNIGFGGACVKVDSLNHKIWVIMGTNSNQVSTVYVYDYLYKAWCDWTELSNDKTTGTGSGWITYLASMPSQLANNFGLANSVWTGSSTGYLSTYAPLLDFQHFSGNTNWPCTFETSIQLGGNNPPDFCPRSILIPYRQLNSTGGASSIFIGWDGAYQSSPSATNVFNAASGLVVIPVTETPDSLGVQPRTMQIKIIYTGNVSGVPTVIEPIYISDEVFG
jgi:hypothetical protein